MDALLAITAKGHDVHFHAHPTQGITCRIGYAKYEYARLGKPRNSTGRHQIPWANRSPYWNHTETNGRTAEVAFFKSLAAMCRLHCRNPEVLSEKRKSEMQVAMEDFSTAARQEVMQ